MDINAIIEKLKAAYPGKKIILNDKNNLTEIVCEIDPTSLHPNYSIVIAVIDQSIPHYHKITEESYEILKGELTLWINDQSYVLKEGEKMSVKPGLTHWAKGDETWVKVSSHPGWTKEDHLISPFR